MPGSFPAALGPVNLRTAPFPRASSAFAPPVASLYQGAAGATAWSGCSTSSAAFSGGPTGAPSRNARRGARQRSATVSAMHSAYPFEESQYHRVQFVDEPYGPMKIYKDERAHVQFTGVMIFRRVKDTASVCENTKVMEIFVAGDTAVNIYTLVNNQQLERPMVHDVMFSIMQQAQVTDPRRWGLLKVAIVELRDDVFIGRLFFGDPLTQKVSWDCDCRPSDGCFLSIKFNAPLFIRDSVWDAASKFLEHSMVHQLMVELAQQGQMPGQEGQAEQIGQQPGLLQQGQPQQVPSFLEAAKSLQAAKSSLEHAAGLGMDNTSIGLSLDYTTLMQDDLDAIKLLKRELALAVAEEDYATAARIRDHPYMRLYKEICTNKLLGLKANAARIEKELLKHIEGNSFKQEPKRNHQ